MSEARQATPAISVTCQHYLEPAECEAWRARLAAGGFEAGTVHTPMGAEIGGERPEIRRCTVQPVTDKPFLAELRQAIEALNTHLYGFDLSGYHPEDGVLAMRYQVGDHFVWHLDNALADAPFGTRKLSFSLQLSPPASYDGGDLSLAAYSEDYGGASFKGYALPLRQVGALIVFPSFHLHRVTPVTRGERLAIVGWLHGPPFR